MSESIVEGMKRSVFDPRDMSDGFMVTQTLTDAMVQHKNKNEKSPQLCCTRFLLFLRS